MLLIKNAEAQQPQNAIPEFTVSIFEVINDEKDFCGINFNSSCNCIRQHHYDSLI